MGFAFVQASFNNTIVTITDLEGARWLEKLRFPWVSADRAKGPRLQRNRQP